MPSFEHKQLIRQIATLDSPPPDGMEFLEWIKAGEHLKFIQENAHSNEHVIYGSGEYSFIHAMAVPEQLLERPDKDDLLAWSCNPFGYAASYSTGGGREGMWIGRGDDLAGSKILEKGTQLVYGRTFEGWVGDGSDYFELLQEYSHLEDVHWRREHGSYCRFNRNGDLDHVVSMTTRNEDKASLVSFQREPLEVYLAASNQVLVQLFDFTLLDRPLFTSWGDEPEQLVVESDDLFYRQKVAGLAAYTRGVHIIRPSRCKADILAAHQTSCRGGVKKECAEFIAHDWRNKRITKISTAPGATTNYFVAKDNELPYELSPAFFRSEVLLKYKGDRDKCQITGRDICCRSAWHLRGFDINEAGQVHVYICDLRKLPYSEQLHWLSYNEEPKARISKRAIENDFQGRWASFVDPLDEVRHRVRKWNDASPPWWCPRDEQIVDRACVPYTTSRDEWADAFLDLTKLVHEGFQVKPLRRKLAERNVPFNNDEKSLALLERLINFVAQESGETIRLDGLRMDQLIRTKTKAHTSGSKAEELARTALQEHETFTNHFRRICHQMHEEMAMIEKTLSDI